MPRPMPDVQQYLPLRTEAALVLLVLSTRPRHGYGVIREVAERSDGEIQLQTGALYRLLRQLLGGGLIVETSAPPDDVSTDERRRYYTITPLGRDVLNAEVERMARLVRAARLTSAGRRPRLV